TSHVANVTSVAWSPNGKLIASASEDGKVYIWDATTDTTQQFFPHKAWVGSLAWSPDSTSIATGDYNDDDSVRIWDISEGRNTQAFSGTSGNQVYTVAWSLDGNHIAGGYNLNEVKIWHFLTGKQVLTYTGHSAPIMSVQWSHKGKYVASSSFDKTVQLWTTS
ncbi:MAG: hypothetical protein E6I91_21475, partial [Chloroflexi bacterium]